MCSKRASGMIFPISQIRDVLTIIVVGNMSWLLVHSARVGMPWIGQPGSRKEFLFRSELYRSIINFVERRFRKSQQDRAREPVSSPVYPRLRAMRREMRKQTLKLDTVNKKKNKKERKRKKSVSWTFADKFIYIRTNERYANCFD